MSDEQKGMGIVELQAISVWFPRKGGQLRATKDWIRAVDDVSLSIVAEETLALVGESGSGKSTLGRTMVGLVEPTSGRILLRGQDVTSARGTQLAEVRREIQMVFQDPTSSLDPLQTVGGAIGEPLEALGIRGATRVMKVEELLKAVGLSSVHGRSYPHELSGGQRQRVAIARALAPEPGIVVCDEPLASLDLSIRAQIINLLRDVQNRRGLSYLFITHDLRTVRHMADRVAVMYRGAIVELADSEVIFRRQHHPYTRALLSSIPSPDPRFERTRERVVLRGEIPSVSELGPGCRMAGRCWLQEELDYPDECRTMEPVLEAVGENGKAEAFAACHFKHRISNVVSLSSPDA